MRSKATRTILAILISAALISLLYSYSNLNSYDFTRLSLTSAALVVMFHCCVLVCRGILMWQLAAIGLVQSSLPALWIRLAARHQFVFTIMPTGLGDLLYPALASRMLRVKPSDAFRIIAGVRARDLIVLPGMAVAGALLMSGSTLAGFAALAATFLLLIKVDWFVRRTLNLVSKVRPRGKVADFFAAAADAEDPGLPSRIRLAVLSSVAWTFATFSVMAAFAAVDQPIGAGLAMLFLASINFFGAIAVSIGGLGVSEIGGATALMFAKRSVERASTLALLVRPLLLASMLTACLVVDFTIALFSSGRGGLIFDDVRRS